MNVDPETAAALAAHRAETEDSDREILDEEVAGEIEAAIDMIARAAERLEGASRAARGLGLTVVAGQLDAYTVPILRRFATDEDPGQPGNLPHLLEAAREWM